MITYNLNFAPTFFGTGSCMHHASIFIRTLTTQTLPHAPTTLTSIVILLSIYCHHDFTTTIIWYVFLEMERYCNLNRFCKNNNIDQFVSPRERQSQMHTETRRAEMRRLVKNAADRHRRRRKRDLELINTVCPLFIIIFFGSFICSSSHNRSICDYIWIYRIMFQQPHWAGATKGWMRTLQWHNDGVLTITMPHVQHYLLNHS